MQVCLKTYFKPFKTEPKSQSHTPFQEKIKCSLSHLILEWWVRSKNFISMTIQISRWFLFNCRVVDFDKNVLTINLESTMGIVILQNASNFVNWRVSTWRNSRWVLIRAILCDSLLEAKSQFCSKSKCRFLTCTIHRPIGTHSFEISYWRIIHSCPCDNKVQPTQRHFYCSFHFHLPYKIWKSWFSSYSRKFCQIRSS